MKINPISNSNILRSYQAAQAPAPKREKAAGKLDEVTFSDEAISFSKTFAEVRDKLEIRSSEEKARIGEIRDAVRAGTYKIDSNKVAESILGSITFD